MMRCRCPCVVRCRYRTSSPTISHRPRCNPWARLPADCAPRTNDVFLRVGLSPAYYFAFGNTSGLGQPTATIHIQAVTGIVTVLEEGGYFPNTALLSLDGLQFWR